MKIALTVDPEIAVPPLYYGGIERIVDLLVTAYIKAGHEVHLFANEQSRTDCKLKVWPGKTATKKVDVIKNTLFITRHYLINRYDVIHSFSRLACLSLVLPIGAKCIMSYQREPTISQIKLAKKLAVWRNLTFTGCSHYISSKIEPYAKSTAIYNAVELHKFKFHAKVENDAPLVFLGRVEPIKGTHNAISLAKATNKKLVIAGNIPTEYHWYFEEEIKPHINDQISYIGPVNDVQKNDLLKSASAFLMLIEWEEPFGIVMAEALACGTPIIGTPCGAVTEIVQEGVNGFIGKTLNEWIIAVNKVKSLDRRNSRSAAEERFSSEVIAKEYLKLYQQR